MRTVPTTLQNHLDGNVLTLARMWKVTRTDGVILGFTDHTRDIVFEDVTYTKGLATSSLNSSEGLQVDNVDIDSFLDSVNEVDIEAGKYDNAQVEFFVVNYIDTTAGKVILKTGRVGEIHRSDGRFKAEIRGLTQQLGVQFGRVFTPLCDVALGSVKCGVVLKGNQSVTISDLTFDPTGGNFITRDDNGSWFGDGFRKGFDIDISGSTSNDGQFTIIDIPNDFTLEVSQTVVSEGPTSSVTCTVLNPFFQSGTVDGVDSVSPRRIFTDSTIVSAVTGIAFQTNFFAEGRVTFTSGANSGITRDIRVSSAGGDFECFLEFPFDIAVSDTFEVTAGCDKTFDTCKNKFDNVINFRGFPDIPTVETVHESPINVGRTSEFTGLAP